METKTIALDREAYDLLKAQKRKGESFSVVVKRLLRPHRSLLDLAGAWKDAPPDKLAAFEKARRDMREMDRKRMDRLLKRME